MHHILAISGSLKSNSSNSFILKAMESLIKSEYSFAIFKGLRELPHFSPEIDIDPAPDSVKHWRDSIARADAVIISTPEYAFGIPGSLKNGLDWIVSSGEFVGKPVALISASPSFLGGDKAHASLLLVMTALGSAISEKCNLIIPAIRKKIDETGNVIDPGLTIQLQSVMDALMQAIEDASTNINT